MTNGSVSLVFLIRTPVFAVSSETKYSSAVCSPKRISVGVSTVQRPSVPLPWTAMQPYAAASRTFAFCAEADQVLLEILRSGAWEQPEKRPRCRPEVVVHLKGEVVRLWLPRSPDELGHCIRMVDMERERSLIVEELAVHRPPSIGVPQSVSDQSRPEVGHDLVKRQRLPIRADDETQTLVRTSERAIVSLDGRR